MGFLGAGQGWVEVAGCCNGVYDIMVDPEHIIDPRDVEANFILEAGHGGCPRVRDPCMAIGQGVRWLFYSSVGLKLLLHKLLAVLAGVEIEEDFVNLRF